MNKLDILEKRIKHLEKIVFEKKAVRSHAPSKAFLIWKFLSGYNGATIDVIKSTFPEEEQGSISSALNDLLDENIITKTGEKYFANKKYVWDDFGVFDDNDNDEVIANINYLLSRVK